MGWFSKSAAEIEKERQEKLAAEQKAIDTRNAQLKAKGAEKNGSFKSFDEVFSPGQSHHVEKHQNKEKLQVSRKSPVEQLEHKKASKPSFGSIFTSKAGEHAVSPGFLTPDKRKKLEAERAKYMPAKLEKEKKAVEAQARANAENKAKFDSAVEADRQRALQRISDKVKPSKFVIEDMQEQHVRKPVLPRYFGYAKRPEKTDLERREDYQDWKEFDNHRRILQGQKQYENQMVREQETHALKEALLHNMQTPGEHKVRGFGLWKERNEAATAKKKAAEALAINEMLPKL